MTDNVSTREQITMVRQPRRPPGLELAFSSFSTHPVDPTQHANSKRLTPSAYLTPNAYLNSTSPTHKNFARSPTPRSPRSATSPFFAMVGAKLVKTPGMGRVKTPSSAASFVRTPVSSKFEQAFVVESASSAPMPLASGTVTTEDFEDARAYLDTDDLPPPPLLTRVIPLPPASPCFRPVGSSSESSGSSSSSTPTTVLHSDAGVYPKRVFDDFESGDTLLSPLWDEDGEDANLFMKGSFAKFWVDGVGSSSSPSSSSSSSWSSSSSSSEDDFTDSDSNYPIPSSPPNWDFIDHGAWCRPPSSPPPVKIPSLLFSIDPEFEIPSPSLLDTENRTPVIKSLFSKLTSALPVELHDALTHGVKLNYHEENGGLGVIIGEKQDWDEFTSSSKEGWGSNFGLELGITSLSVAVVHSLGNLSNGMAMDTQFNILRAILSWAQKDWGSTLEVVQVELPEGFAVPKDCLDATGPVPHQKRSALHTLTWTGEIQLLPEILRCFSPQAMIGIQFLQVNSPSEISVDDALLLLRKFESPGGIRHVEIGGAGVGGCEPVLLPDYFESESDIHPTAPSPPSRKIHLPMLDTLQLKATTSLASFFTSVDLPRLCKLELDLGDERDAEEAEDTLCALFGTVLMPGVGGGGLLYLDVKHGGTFEIGERMKGLVAQREPDAYVCITGGWK